MADTQNDIRQDFVTNSIPLSTEQQNAALPPASSSAPGGSLSSANLAALNTPTPDYTVAGADSSATSGLPGPVGSILSGSGSSSGGGIPSGIISGLDAAVAQIPGPAGQIASSALKIIEGLAGAGQPGQGSPFVGPGGTASVLELAKQVNQAGTASATAQLQAANVVSQGGIQDTACSNTGAQTRLDQSVAAGTSWFEYLGALSYGLLPRILVGAVCIFLIVEGVRMSGKSRK